mgnify:CR=1 FL=1
MPGERRSGRPDLLGPPPVGGHAGPAPDAAGTHSSGTGAPRRPQRGNLNHLALLRVDLPALQRGSIDPGEEVLILSPFWPLIRGIVQAHAAYLAAHTTARVTLEGHADERGTREYNLGLGERRGNAVSGLASAQGGRSGQLAVVSYGEERPTCRVSDEDCWAMNRRVEIVYTAR